MQSKKTLPPRTKKIILVIEDEPSVSEFLTFRLEKMGFHVMIASDGVKGLRLAEKEKPDLIILDLMLPKMPGEEVCRSIKDSMLDELSKIPVIMVTAKDSIVDKVFGKVLGASAYITKPFDFKDLAVQINRLL